MLSAIPIDLITGILSFLFTVLILSYLVGDNPAFRIATHAFVGVSTGYIAVIVFRQVVVNKMFLPFATGRSVAFWWWSSMICLAIGVIHLIGVRLAWNQL